MQPTDPTPGSNGEVVVIDAVRRRRQLEHLLDLRAQLAETAAAHAAHDLPDAREIARQQYAVEDSIRDGWPEVHAQRWPDWVAADARATHGAGELVAGCSICTALARRAGVNLEPPDAA